MREALTDPNEVYEAIQRFERSVLDEYPSPWCKVKSIARVQRDCHCGTTEYGWHYTAELLHGCNKGLIHPTTYWDGCPCRVYGTHLQSGRHQSVRSWLSYA